MVAKRHNGLVHDFIILCKKNNKNHLPSYPLCGHKMDSNKKRKTTGDENRQLAISKKQKTEEIRLYDNQEAESGLVKVSLSFDCSVLLTDRLI